MYRRSKEVKVLDIVCNIVHKLIKTYQDVILFWGCSSFEKKDEQKE